MNITKLPYHIITIIIRNLDVRSQENLYNTSRFFREMICSSPVIKACDLSVSAMATVHTLKSTFFKIISRHLRELNLSVINDLDKETLLLAMQRLERLETLDISYTSLTMTDLPDIHATRPTLRNISINLKFASEAQFGLNSYPQYQLVFEHFKNVHFVGCKYIIHRTFFVAFDMLKKAKLNSLKFTFVTYAIMPDTLLYAKFRECGNLPQFNEFCINLLNWKLNYNYTSTMPVAPLENLKSQSNEIIIIVMRSEYTYKVYASQLFHGFFRDTFNVDAEDVTNTSTALKGNVAIMVWNKTTTEFNQNFFYKLRTRLRQYLPYYCISPEAPAPKEFDWFCIAQKVHGKNLGNYDPEVIQNKVAAENHVLNYDTIFKDRSKVQLRLHFRYFVPGAVTLSAECDYLKKLTFLSLSGKVDYRPEFFNLLFRCCDNLVTLNVDATHAHIHNDINDKVIYVSQCINESLSLTHSLKNFRLVQVQAAPLNELIASLCNCPTLEIIHIVEEINTNICRKISPIALCMLLDKCTNLLRLYIETFLTGAHRIELLNMFNDSKLRLHKNHVTVGIERRVSNMEPVYNYDPYLEVFNVTAIKPV